MISRFNRWRWLFWNYSK
ncbi:unnamed protein product [Debaryomyces tyrocola]|nr:unnamed protein product [Debaryomyces tyrocola]